MADKTNADAFELNEEVTPAPEKPETSSVVNNTQSVPSHPVVPHDPNLTAWSVVALVLGLSSLFFWFGINAIAAVVVGHIALKKLKVRPYDKQNKVFSIIGLISGYLGLGLVLFSVIFTVLSVVLTAIFLWLLTIFGMMAGR